MEYYAGLDVSMEETSIRRVDAAGVDRPERFRHSRGFLPALGLTPRIDQAGEPERCGSTGRTLNLHQITEAYRPRLVVKNTQHTATVIG